MLQIMSWRWITILWAYDHCPVIGFIAQLFQRDLLRLLLDLKPIYDNLLDFFCNTPSVIRLYLLIRLSVKMSLLHNSLSILKSLLLNFISLNLITFWRVLEKSVIICLIHLSETVMVKLSRLEKVVPLRLHYYSCCHHIPTSLLGCMGSFCRTQVKHGSYRFFLW